MTDFAAPAAALDVPDADAEAGSSFGVYVHWPFCAAKCPYCDFNSHVRHRPIDEKRFVAAYRAEIDHLARLAPDRRTGSIFFGGGTPSLMSPAAVAAIIDAIGRAWPLERDAEITLEANPSSVEADRFAGYREAGINRVSLGLQSLHDDALQALGRLHTAGEGLEAYRIARQHFAAVSFDLIYARSGQTLAQWREELTAALGLQPDHLSLYQLTIEAGTPFAARAAAGKLTVPDDDAARELFDLTQELCACAGLPAYETSNHARPGFEARHNLVYWRAGEYAGIGPGAHGRLSIGGRRHATATELHPESWAERALADGHGLRECTALEPVEASEEFLMMGLRLAEGVDPRRFERLRGAPLDAAKIAELVRLGLVVSTAERLRVTAAGRPLLNRLVAELLG